MSVALASLSIEKSKNERVLDESVELVLLGSPLLGMGRCYSLYGF